VPGDGDLEVGEAGVDEDGVVAAQGEVDGDGLGSDVQGAGAAKPPALPVPAWPDPIIGLAAPRRAGWLQDRAICSPLRSLSGADDRWLHRLAAVRVTASAWMPSGRNG
jgi:hypothetical protein